MALCSITLDTADYTNTISGMNELAQSDYKSDFLGGQNHIVLFAEAAPKIDMSNAGAYDQGLCDSFQEAFADYIAGEKGKQDSLKAFFDSVVVKYPELTYSQGIVQQAQN